VILAVPLGLAMGQSIAARILYGIGRLKLFVRVVMAEAAVNLVLSIILAIPFGIAGVALGTALPNLLSNLIVIGYVCHLFNVKGTEYLRTALVGPHLLGLLLGMGWAVAVTLMPVESWGEFLVVGCIGMAVYLPCAALVEFGPRAVWARFGPRLPFLAPR
jgi:O-antigen/teichoic acid export membrane protein